MDDQSRFEQKYYFQKALMEINSSISDNASAIEILLSGTNAQGYELTEAEIVLTKDLICILRNAQNKIKYIQSNINKRHQEQENV